MTGLLILLLAEVSAPLGPFARPGVPVLLATKGETEIVVEGWRYKAEPLMIIHPPFVPCTVRNAAGEELLRLEPVPPSKLIGTTGSAFDVEGGPWQVHIDVVMLPGAYWRCLDVFDEVVGKAPMIDAWKRAGGNRMIPRVGNIAPAIYDLLEKPTGPAASWPSARLIILVTGLALGSLLWLRAHLGLIAAVALIGAAVALLVPGGQFEPSVATEIEVVYHLPEATRKRVFRAHTAVGPGASVTPRPQSTPLHYREAADPWWTGADRNCPIALGISRLFLTEDIEEPSQRNTLEGGEAQIGRLAERFKPKKGRWKVRISRNRLVYTAVD